jgi:integrase/recombinase XerD
MKLYPDAAHLYVNESGSITTPASAKTYLNEMRHLQHAYPGRDVNQFSTIDLATYCLAKGAQPTGAAPKTVSKRIGHLRASFRWWRWRGLVAADPAADLPYVVKPGKGGVRHHTWLTSDQVGLLLASYDAADIMQRRDRLVLMLGLGTGLRLDALGSLRWDQFDDGYSTLRVIVKGNKPLELPVLEELQEELSEWRRHAEGPAVIPSSREQLDPHAGGRRRVLDWQRPLGPAGIYDVVKRAGERIGVKLAPHDMRRSYAGWLEEMGLDLRDIQGLLGHENIATTAGYLEKNPARLRRAVTGLRRN